MEFEKNMNLIKIWIKENKATDQLEENAASEYIFTRIEMCAFFSTNPNTILQFMHTYFNSIHRIKQFRKSS